MSQPEYKRARQQIRRQGLNPVTEGSALLQVHAEGCHKHDCAMYCRCWCHGITKHLNGEIRSDAKAATGGGQ